MSQENKLVESVPSSSSLSKTVNSDDISQQIIEELENCDNLPENHHYNDINFQKMNYQELIKSKEVTEKKFLGTPRDLLFKAFKVIEVYGGYEYDLSFKKISNETLTPEQISRCHKRIIHLGQLHLFLTKIAKEECTFIDVFDENKKKNIKIGQFPLNWFWSRKRVQSFLDFLEEKGKKPTSRRNAALNIKHFLEYLIDFKACEKEEKTIRRMANYLGKFSEICKFHGTRTREGEDAKIDSGKFLTSGEFCIIFFWLFEKITEIGKCFLTEKTDSFAIDFRKHLMTFVFLSMAGVRREVIVNMELCSINLDDLFNFNNDLALISQSEKSSTGRVKGDKIPIPEYLRGPIIFYFQHIRKFLLGSAQSVAFWVSKNGKRLSGSNFSDNFWEIMNRFNPFLNVNPVDIRHFSISKLFANKNTIHNFEETLNDTEQLLNVTRFVMKKHYKDVYNFNDLNDTRKKLLKNMGFNEIENEQKIKKLEKDFANIFNLDLNNMKAREIKRPIRLILKDGEWEQFLIEEEKRLDMSISAEKGKKKNSGNGYLGNKNNIQKKRENLLNQIESAKEIQQIYESDDGKTLECTLLMKNNHFQNLTFLQTEAQYPDLLQKFIWVNYINPDKDFKEEEEQIDLNSNSNELENEKKRKREEENKPIFDSILNNTFENQKKRKIEEAEHNDEEFCSMVAKKLNEFRINCENPWTEEEDKTLLLAITKSGLDSWFLIKHRCFPDTISKRTQKAIEQRFETMQKHFTDKEKKFFGVDDASSV